MLIGPLRLQDRKSSVDGSRFQMMTTAGFGSAVKAQQKQLVVVVEGRAVRRPLLASRRKSKWTMQLVVPNRGVFTTIETHKTLKWNFIFTTSDKSFQKKNVHPTKFMFLFYSPAEARERPLLQRNKGSGATLWYSSAIKG